MTQHREEPTWNRERVIRTSISNDQLQIDFGDEWYEFLSEGRLRELCQAAEGRLQQFACTRTKGKGTGKGKSQGKSLYGGMSFIDPTNY